MRALTVSSSGSTDGVWEIERKMRSVLQSAAALCPSGENAVRAMFCAAGQRSPRTGGCQRADRASGAANRVLRRMRSGAVVALGHLEQAAPDGGPIGRLFDGVAEGLCIAADPFIPDEDGD